MRFIHSTEFAKNVEKLIMTEFKQLVNSHPLVLVNFGKADCETCGKMPAILDKVKASLGETVKIVEIDVTERSPVAAEFMVDNVPTLILFKKGEEIWRETGIVEDQHLVTRIEKHK